MPGSGSVVLTLVEQDTVPGLQVGPSDEPGLSLHLSPHLLTQLCSGCTCDNQARRGCILCPAVQRCGCTWALAWRFCISKACGFFPQARSISRDEVVTTGWLRPPPEPRKRPGFCDMLWPLPGKGFISHMHTHTLMHTHAHPHTNACTHTWLPGSGSWGQHLSFNLGKIKVLKD